MNTDIFAQLNIDSYLTNQIHTYPQTLHVETKEHRRIFATKHNQVCTNPTNATDQLTN